MGYADLTLGDRVEPVLEAQIARRRRPLPRRAPLGGWDAEPDHRQQPRGPTGPGLYRRAGFPRRPRRLTALGLSLDAWLFHPQLADVVDLARAFPDANIVMGHIGGVLGYGPYAGRQDEVFATWKALDDRAGPVPATCR